MRIGIIGSGRIAKRFCAQLLQTEDISVEAVFNPKQESAEVFLRQNFPEQEITPVSDLDSFLGRAIDAVYIASPHGTHADYTRAALAAGKHVLCEKPMGFQADQCRALYELAEQNGVFLMEGIKTSFCPGFLKLEETVRSGVIGDIVDVEAAFTRLTDSTQRELQDARYGGSFTEFGSYNMTAVFRFLGTGFRDVRFESLKSGSVDGYTKAIFTYENAFATSKTGLTAKSEGQLLLTGTKGYILVPSPWWLTSYFEVRYEDPSRIDRYDCVYEGDGFSYEIEFFQKMASHIAQKREEESECLSMLQTETIARADVMERFLCKR